MEQTDRTRSAPEARSDDAPAGPPSITPVFPLLLLETMRDMDRPEEILEDEDLTVSLPRRLGLSDVVSGQIRRLQGEVRARRPQSAAQVADLIRLVIRRPDAEEIFDEAGRRVARYYWEQRAGAMRALLPRLPGPLSRSAAQRAAHRLFRQVVGVRGFTLAGSPPELSIARSLTAEADPGGAACAFFSGALAEVMTLYTGKEHAVTHSECSARGGERCQWTAAVTG
jgi:predicted hydrocarbon binding protein